MRNLRLGTLAGLTVTAAPSALAGTLLLWLALSALALWWLRLPPLAAVLGGLLAALAHPLSEVAHQLGHAWAARRTGHPMLGFHFWLVLGSSVYPADEAELPGRVHVRRALGGPAASMVVTMAAGLVALALFSLGGVARYLSLFIALDNLLVFTLGSLLPLGFTDGSTLLTWWGRE